MLEVRKIVHMKIGRRLTWAGNLRSLNDLAETAKADYVLHTGDFGFYDETSLERIADK